jgi:D-alanine--poly(phosphoribitol) ligase subunit 2
MKETILSILENICEDSIVRENLDLNLFETGLMDSLGFTELLVYIEDEFGIVLSPSEISREEMDTPNKIIALVAARSH